MTRKLALLLPLTLLVVAAPVAAIQIKLLEPLQGSLVQGIVPLRVETVDAPNEQFFSNPEIVVINERGTELEKLPAVRDPKTRTASANWDSRKYSDGLYTFKISYRNLLGGSKAQSTEEEINIGVRNGKNRPARFGLEYEDVPYGDESSCDVMVKVVDARGKPFAGARVAFQVNGGELDTTAEITDSDGEAGATVDSDEVRDVILTVTVENLRPVQRRIRFVK